MTKDEALPGAGVTEGDKKRRDAIRCGRKSTMSSKSSRLTAEKGLRPEPVKDEPANKRPQGGERWEDHK